jgi:hypothetical protein
MKQKRLWDEQRWTRLAERDSSKEHYALSEELSRGRLDRKFLYLKIKSLEKLRRWVEGG